MPGGTVFYDVRRARSARIEHGTACTGNAGLPGRSRFPLYLYTDWWICTNYSDVVSTAPAAAVAYASRKRSAAPAGCWRVRCRQSVPPFPAPRPQPSCRIRSTGPRIRHFAPFRAGHIDQEFHRPKGCADESLGHTPAEQPATPKRKKVAHSHQTGLKLPIKGRKVAADRVEKASAPPPKPVRKRA